MNNKGLENSGIGKTILNLNESRRAFLKKAAAASVLLASADLTFGAINPFSKKETTAEIPWYRCITRWGQTNITEKDPAHYDIAWWRKHWEDTQAQGIIVNAGGIVAYYPSKVPLHRQAQFLEGRDLFGDLCRAAHEDGLVVFARRIQTVPTKSFTRLIPTGLPSMLTVILTKPANFSLPVSIARTITNISRQS